MLDSLTRISLSESTLAKLESDKLERIDLDKLELALEELQSTYVSQLWGKELVKPTNIPELQSLQKKELVEMTTETLDKLELDKAASSLKPSAYNCIALRMIDEIKDELSASHCTALLQKPDEGRRAFALGDAAWRPESDQLQLLDREIVFKQAFSKSDDQLSLSGGASEALAAFTKSSPTMQPKRTSISLSSILLSIFFILMVSIFPSKSLENSFDNNFIHCCAFQLVEQDELSPTFGQKELGKKNEFHKAFLWDQELEELLVDKTCPLDPPYDHLGQEKLWSVQLQQNLLENDEQKELQDQELQEKNFHKSFQKKIFLKKLDALLLEWHFAKAASHQLVGIKAGEKHREASKEIGFDKVGDKELPQEELRREELGCKDLWPAYFRALCPHSFEENSFTNETFSNTSLGEESSTRSSLAESSFAENSFTESTFLENNFLKNSFSKTSFDNKSFANKSFDNKSFAKTSFDKKSFAKQSFDKKSFDRQTFQRQLRTQQLGGLELPLGSFDDSSFEKSRFTQSSLEESSFTKSSFRESSLRGSSFNKDSFAQESLTSTAFTKSFAQTSFHRRSFNYSSLEESSFTKSSSQNSSLEENSFNESSFEENSFTKHSFEESSFAKSSLEESSLTPGSFEQSSFETNSFELCTFEATSFTESSFQEANFPTVTSFRTELSKPQRSSLRPELGHLEEPALKKGAFNLELSTAHSKGKLGTFLGGSRLKTASFRGGVLKPELAPAYPSLTDSLSTIIIGGSSLAWLPKRKLLLSKLSRTEIVWELIR